MPQAGDRAFADRCCNPRSAAAKQARRPSPPQAVSPTFRAAAGAGRVMPFGIVFAIPVFRQKGKDWWPYPAF